MIVTIEMSLYPLTTDYEGPIVSFIHELKKHEGLEIMSTSMSTFVKGEGRVAFAAITSALEEVDNEGFTASLVMKVINRNLPVEKGFLDF